MRRIWGNTGTRNIFFFQINQSTKVSSILRGNVGKLEKKCRNETPIQESTLIPFACFLQPPPLVASEDTSLFLTTETHPPTHPSVCSYFALPLSHRHYVPFAGWLRVSIATRHRGQTREHAGGTYAHTHPRSRVGGCRSMRAPTCRAWSDPF